MQKNILAKLSCITLFMLCINLFPSATVKANAYSSGEQKLFQNQEQVIQVFNSSNNNISISKNDIYLMAQTVFAESCAEPYEGKVAVASVIINRLKSTDFPKSINGVILQKEAFSCVVNGKIDAVPDTACFQAVYEALKGNDPTNNALFFCNPRTSTSPWMKNISKKNLKTIGNHIFFSI